VQTKDYGKMEGERKEEADDQPAQPGPTKNRHRDQAGIPEKRGIKKKDKVIRQKETPAYEG